MPQKDKPVQYIMGIRTMPDGYTGPLEWFVQFDWCGCQCTAFGQLNMVNAAEQLLKQYGEMSNKDPLMWLFFAHDYLYNRGIDVALSLIDDAPWHQRAVWWLACKVAPWRMRHQTMDKLFSS